MVVGHGASGLWQINEKNLQLKKLRSLVHLGASLHKGQKVYEHVKAHSGCPGNELVDGLARHCLRHPEQHVLHGFPSWQPIFQEGHDALQWAWWHVSVLRGDCYHPSGDADGVKWRQGDRGVEVSGVSSIERQEETKIEGVHIVLKMAAYNVLTLRSSTGRDGESGEDWKASLLRDQFEELGLHAVGLQETRSTQRGLLVTQNFFRLMGQADEGHHGCELWLARHVALNKGRQKAYFEKDGLIVLFESPRILLVQAKVAGLSLLFFVLHAPHDGSGSEVKEQWWNTVWHLFHRFREVGQVFCLGDFNARLGSSVESCIGDRVCPFTTDNGFRLQRLMESFSMWAPSTFDSVRRGRDATWTHPKGATARLDYILCGGDPGIYVADSYVDDQVQTSLTVRDHEMVIAVVHIWQSSSSWRVSPKRGYDWELMNILGTREGLRHRQFSS